jgi:mycothiol synthase
MSGVSNFLLRRNDGKDLEVRPVQRSEIDQALRLILAGSTGRDSDEAVLDFLQMASWRNLDLTMTWVAAPPDSDRLVWAVLPIVSPGRGMILMVPPRLRPGLFPRHVAELVASATLEPRRHECNLVQILIDPEHRAVSRAIADCGFETIAELIYLGRQVRDPVPGRVFDEHRFHLWRYDRKQHIRFAETIERSYEGSMDCPKLNGKRHIEDIIASHKSAGEFDPEMWHLLTDSKDRELGVMLLNRLNRREGYELVYIGLVPEARGKRLADMLMRIAVNALAHEGGGAIVTAVDAANSAGRKLYHRHGFGFMYSRLAYGKLLKPATEQSLNLIATSRRLLALNPDPQERPLLER